MTNPHLYVPQRVSVTELHTVFESELGSLFGFHLRMKAAQHLRDMRSRGDRSPTLRATDVVMAQALTRMADEVDPEHKHETSAVYLSNGSEVLAG